MAKMTGGEALAQTLKAAVEAGGCLADCRGGHQRVAGGAVLAAPFAHVAWIGGRAGRNCPCLFDAVRGCCGGAADRRQQGRSKEY